MNHHSAATMTTKEMITAWKQKYLDRIPGNVPADKIVVHNHVRPTRQLGMRGFRAWLDEPSPKYETCSCGWAPEIGTHYRVAW